MQLRTVAHGVHFNQSANSQGCLPFGNNTL